MMMISAFVVEFRIPKNNVTRITLSWFSVNLRTSSTTGRKSVNDRGSFQGAVRDEEIF